MRLLRLKPTGFPAGEPTPQAWILPEFPIGSVPTKPATHQEWHRGPVISQVSPDRHYGVVDQDPNLGALTPPRRFWLSGGPHQELEYGCHVTLQRSRRSTDPLDTLPGFQEGSWRLRVRENVAKRTVFTFER